MALDGGDVDFEALGATVEVGDAGCGVLYHAISFDAFMFYINSARVLTLCADSAGQALLM